MQGLRRGWKSRRRRPIECLTGNDIKRVGEMVLGAGGVRNAERERAS